MTNGRANWYRVVRSSRIVAENRPTVQSSAYGTWVSFGSGASIACAYRFASSRTVSGGLVGTSHARPQPRSSVATLASVFATSEIDVQLCGTSNGVGTYARFPVSTGAPSTTLKIEFASM